MSQARPKITYSRKRRSEPVLELPKRLKSTTTTTTTTSTTTRSKTASSTSFTNNKAPTTRLNVYVFGEGSAGELGLGTRNATDVTRPRLNALLDIDKVGVVDIATGGMHAVALTHDSHVLTWGVNDNNALGRDTAWEGGLRDIAADEDADDDASSEDSDSGLNPYESTPTAIPAESFGKGHGIVRVTAGDSASFALTEQGFVYGWGTFVSNEAKTGFYWEPTQNQLIKSQIKPMLIPGLEKIVQVSAGNNFCLALNAHGKVYSWGMSEQNQLGRRLVVARQLSSTVSEEKLHELYLYVGLHPSLVPFPSRTRIVSVHAGSDHAFAIDRSGDTWAWGLNNFGQTGIKIGAGANGTTVIAPQKVQSLRGRDMKMIQGGTHHSIGVTHKGECLVWGRMDGAQMGIDLNTSALLDDPTKVVSERGKPRILLEPTALPISKCSFVAAGSDHNIVITSDGTAYSWGFNANYQCGQGHGDDIAVATLIDNSAVRGKKLTWAGAGGQYSMVAG